MFKIELIIFSSPQLASLLNPLSQFVTFSHDTQDNPPSNPSWKPGLVDIFHASQHQHATHHVHIQYVIRSYQFIPPPLSSGSLASPSAMLTFSLPFPSPLQLEWSYSHGKPVLSLPSYEPSGILHCRRISSLSTSPASSCMQQSLSLNFTYSGPLSVPWIFNSSSYSSLLWGLSIFCCLWLECFPLLYTPYC